MALGDVGHRLAVVGAQAESDGEAASAWITFTTATAQGTGRLTLRDGLADVLFTAIALVSGSLWGQPTWGTHLADELERLIGLHDASTIAAVIVGALYLLTQSG